ncbi:hypothetical protein [Agrobacterium tumefaciens]|uniref:hypothetical protein n=1 Tax=Agrobacterium tumefaciens TaxID=358 RepID=UPI00023A5245|nr:hypothetical protein AT5A_14952 [Agrobacterium tumefaciens 5A]
MSEQMTRVTDVVDLLNKVSFVQYTTGWSSTSLAKDAVCEITRLRQLLSEAETREREARAKALGDAAEAIFVMGAWSPKYEKLTPNTFDEGTSAAYEIVRELQGKADSDLQAQEGGDVTSQ